MIFITAYLSVHFLLYTLVLRNLRFFYQEKNIFLYHAISFLGVSTAGVGLVVLEPAVLGPVIGAVSLHGIYSLSFLELWALSDGGYSLRILDQIDNPRAAADFKSLEVLGASKKKYRLSSLERLRLVAPHPAGWMLTSRGRAVAVFLGFFVFISKQKERV